MGTPDNQSSSVQADTPQGRLPVVVIVGRPNVGKSSIFNKLIGARISIEDPKPGTTRDRVSFMLNIEGRVIELVDAAGMGLIDEHKLEAHVEEQISISLDLADICVFVVDIKDGVLPLDTRVANRLRRLGKPVVLVANKSDAPHHDDLTGEFHRLGLGAPIPVSAKESRNIEALQDAIVSHLPEGAGVPVAPPIMKLAIVGKRNSGKSSLVNFLAKDERMIVSPIPGTTRDAVDVRFTYKDMDFVAIDTAGIQRKQSVAHSVDFFSQARSVKSIRRADVVVLLLDCREEISRLDKKLAEEAVHECKPVVIAVNKWDLAGGVDHETYRTYIVDRLPLLAFAPVVFLSVLKGEGCFELVDAGLDLRRQSFMRVTTGELNRAVHEAFDRQKPRGKYGKPPRLFYATQIEVTPPTILVYVNDARIFGDDWRDFLKNWLRKSFAFGEIPLKIIMKNRQRVELDV